MKPKAIVADLHLHNWQSFAQVDASSGINTRLQLLLRGLLKTAKTLQQKGGDALYVAGDLFHVRGKIAPSVLNPALSVFKSVIDMGIKVRIIPGNHDLEGKDSHALGNAVAALKGVGCDVCERPVAFDDDMTIIVPWFDRLDELRAAIKCIADQHGEARSEYDLVIHAPVNGVIVGLPDHGLTGEELAAYGFRRVFAGHYHNHKEVAPGVISIGALAHHTWSDVGTTAGFVLAYEDRIEQYGAGTPLFIDTPDLEGTNEDLEQAVKGNYVRVKVEEATNSEVATIREGLTKLGALGVVIQPVKKAAVKREAAVSASVKSGASVETSVSEFVKARYADNAVAIDKEAQRVLAEASVEVEQ